MKDKLIFILSMIIFGSIGLFVREIPLTSVAIAFYRGILGTLFFVILFLILRHKINYGQIKGKLILLLLSGTFIGFNWIFLFESYRYTSITNATLSYYLAPLIVVLLSPFVLKEKLTIKKLTAVTMGFLGLIFILNITGSNFSIQNDGKGILLGVMAALLYAGVVLMNRFLKNIGGMELTFFQLGIATITLFPYLFVQNDFRIPSVPLQSLPLLLIVGLLHTGIAYFMYFSSMKKLSSSTIAVFSYIDPIVALLLSTLLLKEGFSISQGIGALLILGGSFLGSKE